MHSDYFKARTRISLYPHDVFESSPLISLSISSGLVGYKNTEFVGRLQEQVWAFALQHWFVLNVWFQSSSANIFSVELAGRI